MRTGSNASFPFPAPQCFPLHGVVGIPPAGPLQSGREPPLPTCQPTVRGSSCSVLFPKLHPPPSPPPLTGKGAEAREGEHLPKVTQLGREAESCVCGGLTNPQNSAGGVSSRVLGSLRRTVRVGLRALSGTE